MKDELMNAVTCIEACATEATRMIPYKWSGETLAGADFRVAALAEGMAHIAAALRALAEKLP